MTDRQDFEREGEDRGYIAAPAPNEVVVSADRPVAKPPRARVSDAPLEDAASAQSARESFERKRDYLEGFLAEKTPGASPGEPGGALYEAAIEALKDIFDPEIPVNIYDLGLIYGVEVTDEADITVTMTLTTPHCPVAETMPNEIEMRMMSLPGARDAEVVVTWDPPWDPSKMSDEARLELGML